MKFEVNIPAALPDGSFRVIGEDCDTLLTIKDGKIEAAEEVPAAETLSALQAETTSLKASLEKLTQKVASFEGVEFTVDKKKFKLLVPKFDLRTEEVNKTYTADEVKKSKELQALLAKLFEEKKIGLVQPLN